MSVKIRITNVSGKQNVYKYETVSSKHKRNKIRKLKMTPEMKNTKENSLNNKEWYLLWYLPLLLQVLIVAKILVMEGTIRKANNWTVPKLSIDSVPFCFA